MGRLLGPLRDWAPVVLAVSAALHLGALVLAGSSAPLGQWLVVWGVALVTGLVVQQVLASQRQLGAQQRRLVEQLRQADATKTALVHSVGHELARPMTALVGLAETLREHVDELSPAQQAELAERLAVNARRLQGMLDGLLDLGRLTRGTVSFDLDDMKLADAVREAVNLASASDRVEVADLDDIVVRADPVRLPHALANLVDNAVKYGGGAPIEIDAIRRSDGVVLVVADHGPGVPDDTKQRVFDPFERARPEDAAHGTGLGLSLVRQFAQLHGGTVWLEDQPGGGTRACLWLPCLREHVLAASRAGSGLDLGAERPIA